jgi:hypothetical protein
VGGIGLMCKFAYFMGGNLHIAWEMRSHFILEICAALRVSRAPLYRYVKETEPPA